ncbi:MAG TPA: SDR family oxidoreductase [Ktedonobacteraceae bacterium]
MKFALFGATGRTGQPLVEQALACDHEVVALVRTPSQLTFSHPKLSVLQGDVLNQAEVEQSIQGTQAVITVIGHSKNTPRTLLAVGAQHILTAMQQQGVQRLICLTGAGVADPHDRPRLVNHLFTTALKLLAADVLADSEQQYAAIRHSSLDWTVVRVPRLINGPHTGQYRVGWVGVGTGTVIRRTDVADFLLRQLTDETYLRQAPMISN